MARSWSVRVAPGVAIMRERANSRLAYITLDDELLASARLIEEMAAKLDFGRHCAAWGAYLAVLVGVVAILGGR